ncbi:MAG: RsiW-degrading membrane proteinase PrsW (M82 family), partial [Cyclobacteriaceae bacterium]
MGELEIVMYVGFLLAAYSVVGNDVIQTLGTFLSSNENKPWWMLSLFAGSILAFVLIYGWYVNDGDVTYGRLIGDPIKNSFENPKYNNPEDIKGFGWPFLIPPLILLTITRFGIPVSTSFLILTFFNPKNLYDMVVKSMSGYLVAFVAAILIYMVIAKKFEKHFAETKPTKKETKWWTVAQWLSTGFLWSQWLIQDFANIYVYLPRQIDFVT